MAVLVNLAAISRDGITDEIIRIENVLGTNKRALKDLAELAELFAAIRMGVPAIKLNTIKISTADEKNLRFLLIRSGRIEFEFELDGKEWVFNRSNI